MAESRSTISVVIVSDYASGGPEAWKDIRRTLSALAGQKFDAPVEYLLCESEHFRDRVPADLATILPSLEIRYFPCTSANELKNAAAQAASGDFVAFLDADCTPSPDWLSHAYKALTEHPQAAAVAGKTVYGDNALWVRISTLVGRSYVNPGGAGPTRFLAVNNSIYRRSAYLACPLPEGMGAFSSRIQSEQMLRGGWELRFSPDIAVVHDFEGWSMEADFRRNCGHGTVRTRLEDPTLPYAWVVKLGPFCVVPILAGKILNSWGDCFRCWRDYGLRWYEVQAACILTIPIHMLEVPGMLQAFGRKGLKASTFR